MSAKKGIPYDEVGPYLEIAASADGWSLCIGAGISRPMFPTWNSLTKRLINKEAEKESDALSESLLDQNTPDTIIQAAQDRLGLDDEEFSGLLAEELYRTMEEKLSAQEFDLFKLALKADDPMEGAENGSYDKLLEITRRQQPRVSALPIARSLVDVLNTKKEPRAVLSFNAETLLYALCNAFIWKDWQKNNESEPGHYPGLTKEIDLITHSISTRMDERVPYVMCHGLLSVPGYENQKPFDPGEKLVFSENDYLKLANSSYSWQSSEFLSRCSSTRVVFVGVSLSDSNMRQWLTWVHQNRMNELRSLDTYEGGVSTSHFWVQKSPDSEEQKRWIESSVAHLGVRLIWVEEWSQIDDVFQNLLDLD